MTRRRAKGSEWLGGVRTMGVRVLDAEVPYLPDGLMWMDASTGDIVGMDMRHPDAGVEHAADHLRASMANPMTGRPREPARIRTGSEALADALAKGLADTHPEVEIVLAPTPELDEMFVSMDAMLSANADAPTWLGAGASPAAVASYFEAMDALYGTRPWTQVPGEAAPMRIDCPALGIEDELLCIVGQLGESFGLMRFADEDAFAAFVAFAEDPGRVDLDAPVPTHAAYTFDPLDDIAPNVVTEVHENGWRVIDDAAWPTLTLLDATLGLRSPDDDDLAIGEMLARAVTHAVTERGDALRQAHAGEETAVLELDVHAFGTPVHVRLTAWSEPYPLPPVDGSLLAAPGKGEATPDPRDTAQLVEALRTLQRESGSTDLDDVAIAVEETTHAILSRFEASADARAFEFPLEGPGMLLEFAATHLGRTLPALDERTLDEVLFDIVPATIPAGPDIAREIIDTARAFFVWLKGETPFEKADALIERLDDDAVRLLEARLSDPDNFSPAKAMIVRAIDEGVDLTSEKAVHAFMRAHAGEFPDDPFLGPAGFDADGLPPANDLTPEQRRAADSKRKKNRKAARKARKRNR